MKTALLGLITILFGACSPPTKVTFGTLNTAQGNGYYAKATYRHAQAWLLDEVKADVVGLQEVDYYAERSGRSFTAIESLGLTGNTLLGGYQDESDILTMRAPEGVLVWGEALAFSEEEGGGYYGLATFVNNRFEVVSVEKKRYKGETDEPRIALIVRTKDFTIMNTHLSVYGRNPAAYRASQLEQLRQWAIAEGGPVIILGDFNESPAAVGAMLVDMKPCSAGRGSQIDQIWATGIFKAMGFTVQTDTTDHGAAVFAQVFL